MANIPIPGVGATPPPLPTAAELWIPSPKIKNASMNENEKIEEHVTSIKS